MSDFWNARWGETLSAYGDLPNVFLAEEGHRIPPGGHVVCLADGDGRNGTWLAREGYTVTGVDASEVGVARARARGVEGYRADVADLADWEVPACDGVVSIYAHFPPALRVRVHTRAWEALRPGGVVLLEAFQPAQLARSSGGPKDEAMLYTEELLRGDFPGARFEILETATIELAEGPYHIGPAEVVRMVARKPSS
jgi:SAM-dependent methyltransferase